ncbi:hypothetical protein AVEN_36364-1 [Araneus ventricosus]|uniref:Uncharacterized protein n=1 Tax=Araneus ventricosus TaxID=182803 RepID=A0A4Y2GAX2_ARAVE|nr:hypothetical protein AVEN_36364-1 [Araneus ventricosus]
MKLEIPCVGENESGWREFCDTEPCLKTNFGTSANALPNFLTNLGLGQMAYSGPLTVAPFWNFWNTRRKNLSSRSKTYEILCKWFESGGIQKNLTT